MSALVNRSGVQPLAVSAYAIAGAGDAVYFVPAGFG